MQVSFGTNIRKKLLITLVTYNPDMRLLGKSLASLSASINSAVGEGLAGECILSVADNGPGCRWKVLLEKLLKEWSETTLHAKAVLYHGHGNIGYGQGHNLAATVTEADYLLIMNPDVLLEVDTISMAVLFMERHRDTAMIAPYVRNQAGRREYLCKRYPSIATLAVRGFGTPLLRRLMQNKLSAYEMHDLYYSSDIVGRSWRDVPIISGCFMFCRYNRWKEAGGFSKDFFMYFEDFDLSLRMGQIAAVRYVPEVRITHLGGYATSKGIRHILMFIRSGITFFRKHGWKLW